MPEAAVLVQFDVCTRPVKREIPSTSLSAGSSLRLKNGYARDDALVQKTKRHHHGAERSRISLVKQPVRMLTCAVPCLRGWGQHRFYLTP